jgi:DNA repair protein RecN (Recombination protein N)
MFEEIRISSLGVIESSTLELGPGLTVITGETGAGKTMVVTALSLLLGGRADTGAVRSGSAHARVESSSPATSPPRGAPARGSAAPPSRSRGWPR